MVQIAPPAADAGLLGRPVALEHLRRRLHHLAVDAHRHTLATRIGGAGPGAVAPFDRIGLEPERR
jgi:hypothetical protein